MYNISACKKAQNQNINLTKKLMVSVFEEQENGHYPTGRYDALCPRCERLLVYDKEDLELHGVLLGRNQYRIICPCGEKFNPGFHDVERKPGSFDAHCSRCGHVFTYTRRGVFRRDTWDFERTLWKPYVTCPKCSCDVYASDYSESETRDMDYELL